jgi:hypothetical protein
MKRIISTTAILGLAIGIFALGNMVKVVQDTYKYPATSAAGTAKCMLCHVGKMGGKLNGYGSDLKVALKGSKSLTAAMLHSVDAKDSDGDGAKNGDELKAGKNPGVK